MSTRSPSANRRGSPARSSRRASRLAPDARSNSSSKGGTNEDWQADLADHVPDCDIVSVNRNGGAGPRNGGKPAIRDAGDQRQTGPRHLGDSAARAVSPAAI